MVPATALMLVSALLVTLPATAPPAASEAATGAPPALTTFPRPDDPDAHLRAALAEARKRGEPVPVEAAYTEATRTWAYPDGHLTTQSYAAPAQLKQADGTWGWIDTTLVEQNGVLKPRLTKADVRLSTGGDGPFVALERDRGERLALSWPSDLPRPEVTGNVATYRDAAGKGADLVVTALATGFRHDVVLRERPKGQVEFRMPADTGKLKLAAVKSGGLKLTDAKGRVQALAPAPVMVDSGRTTSGKAPQQLNRRTGKIITKVETEGGKSVLVLKPDAGFLAAADTVYPVVVDPTTTLGLVSDTTINSIPPSPFWTSWDDYTGELLTVGGGLDLDGSEEMDHHRAFLQFDTAPLAGRAVSDARLELWAVDAVDCLQLMGGMKVSRVTEPWEPGGLNWDELPAVVENDAQTQLCKDFYDDDELPRAFTWPITGITQAWTSGAPNHGVQVRAVKEDEDRFNDAWGWVDFHSAEMTGSGARPPKLTVSYMLPPEIPTITAESIDSLSGNDAIARSTSVKVGFKSSVAEARPLDYTVTVNDSTMAPPPSIPSGARAYWKFDETTGDTAADSSGGNATATFDGDYTRGPGQIGQAVTFTEGHAATTGPLVHTTRASR
ncbi:DNRLRE domain-containing protein [Nonomuraea sp. LPB2021202275-12-8]|uniref:DNRLRE domain-containing protein n=1 Tax=Nonomuraea sp. LPB2021202275-12-8 TaxID=3120159 RepID=UPI00300D3F2C